MIIVIYLILSPAIYSHVYNCLFRAHKQQNVTVLHVLSLSSGSLTHRYEHMQINDHPDAPLIYLAQVACMLIKSDDVI